MTDITNEDRAERARAAIERYVAARDEVFENSSSEIADLIADLLHLAVRLDEGDDPVESTLRLARLHYEAEKAEEDPAQLLAQGLSDALAALKRIAEITHYENDEPVTALDSREIEDIYADAVGQIETLEATLKTARKTP